MADLVSSSVTAEEARRLTEDIKAAVAMTWELVEKAYTFRAWAALGYSSWDDYCAAEFHTSHLRLPREERQEVVASLRDAGLSTRAIAAATGVGVGTVHRDLSGVPGGTPETDAADIDVELVTLVRDLDEIGSRVGVSPIPRPVTGVDGKSYRSAQRTASTTRKRPSLPDLVRRASSDLRSAAARLAHFSDDDRFSRHGAEMAEYLRGDLTYTVDVAQALLAKLPDKEN